MNASRQRTRGGTAWSNTAIRVAVLVTVVAGCLAGVGTAAAENVTSAASADDAPPAEAGAQLPGATAPAAVAGVLAGVFVAIGVFTYRELE